MKKVYGPFYCSVHLWHWHKECKDFPIISHPRVMVKTVLPKTSELCKNCIEIDEQEIKETIILPEKINENY